MLSRHRKYGSVASVRKFGTEEEVAGAFAKGRNTIGLLYDR